MGVGGFQLGFFAISTSSGRSCREEGERERERER
jgi:hypothetical protein